MKTPESGAAAVEVAVLAPALVALLLLVVAAGRVTTADARVRDLAADAARAASMRASRPAAVAAAEAAVADAVARGEVPCRTATAHVDSSGFRPGGHVSVAVHCVVDLSDLAMVGLPGERTFQSTAIEVVDRYRSDR